MNEIENAKLLMSKTVGLLKTQLCGLRDNVNESLLSNIKIDYNGQPTCLCYISLIVQDDRRISITPYDLSSMGLIEEELKKQGFDAYKFSKTSIVVNIPLACGENSNKILVQIKRLAEDAKIAVRNIRRKFRKKIKDKDVDKELQKITDKAISEIDGLI